MPDSVLQHPVAVDFFPQVWRPKRVNGGMKAILGMGNIVQKLGKKTIRELLIKFLNESDALLSRDFSIANLLGSIVGCPTDPELREGCVLVVRVNFVVDAAVLGVRTLCSLDVRFKARVLRCIVEALLGVPLQVVPQIVHLDT